MDIVRLKNTNMFILLTFCFWLQAFCGWGGYDISYHLYTFAITWIISDFVEFAYHLLGHSDIKYVP